MKIATYATDERRDARDHLRGQRHGIGFRIPHQVPGFVSAANPAGPVICPPARQTASLVGDCFGGDDLFAFGTDIQSLWALTMNLKFVDVDTDGGDL